MSFKFAEQSERKFLDELNPAISLCVVHIKEINMKIRFLSLLLAIFLSLTHVPAVHAELKVVATQALFADLVKEVGGDKVEVKSIASPKFNVHFYSPKPSDVRAVKEADLYVNAGLDLEAWSDPLLEAAGKPNLMRGQPGNVDLSTGIELLDVPVSLSRAQGDVHVFGNPHFHMDPENSRIMVRTLTKKMQESDPANAEYFSIQEAKFLKQLDEKIVEWKKLCRHCQGQEIVSYHEDIAYFARFLGLRDQQYIEPKPGIPPTARHLQFLEKYIQDQQVKAIVLPTYYSRNEAKKLATRVGANVITICQNAGELSGTEGFFNFFDHNFRQISEGLQ